MFATKCDGLKQKMCIKTLSDHKDQTQECP